MHRSRQPGRRGEGRGRRPGVGRSETRQQALRRRSAAGSGCLRALGCSRVRMTCLQRGAAGLVMLMTGFDCSVGLRLDAGRRLLLEFEYLGPTDDAAQRQTAVGDGGLYSLDEALTTHDAVTTRQRFHRRLGRQADHALQTSSHANN